VNNVVVNEIGQDRLEYYFDTAWSPPSAFVKAASAKFPTLLFELEFEEPGMVFRGSEKFSEGVLIQEVDTSDAYHEELSAEWEAELAAEAEWERQQANENLTENPET